MESVGRFALPSVEPRGSAFTAADCRSPGVLSLCHLMKEHTRSLAVSSALGPVASSQTFHRASQWHSVSLSPCGFALCAAPGLQSHTFLHSLHLFSLLAPLLFDFQWSFLSGQSLTQLFLPQLLLYRALYSFSFAP